MKAPESVATWPTFSLADLANLPQPSWLIKGILPAHALSVLYGSSGVGKTFLALDWALCIETGLAWYGRETQRGPVLYIAAEGTSGLHSRVQAWQQARRHEATDIRFLPHAVNLLDDHDTERASRTITELPDPPALVVIDTMARTMVGGDENAARDVGRFISNVDQLRNLTSATALVVHHTGKSGEDERGSSALRGAADLMASMKEDGAGIRLECSKAKDAEPFEPWTLHLANVAESCVLRLGSNRAGLSADERRILETLPAAFGRDPAASGKLQTASGVPERSYYRAVQTLEQRGYLSSTTQGRTKLYTLTDDGATALLPTTANHCQTVNAITAANATTLGVAVGSNHDSNTQHKDLTLLTDLTIQLDATDETRRPTA